MATKPLDTLRIKIPGSDNTYVAPKVDATLAVAGAAADAKATGDQITELKDDLDEITEKGDNLFYFTDTTNRTYNGVSLTFLDNSTVKVNGTVNVPSTNLYGLGDTSNSGNHLKSGDYIVRYEIISGTISSNPSIRYGSSSTTWSNKTAKTMPEDTSIFLRLANGAVANDAVIRVSLFNGAELKPYEEGNVNHAIDTVARASIENISEILYDTIPQKYFDSEIDSVATSILEKSEMPCLTLNIVTDTHWNAENADNNRRTNDTINNVRAVNSKVYCDAIAHLGDFLIADQEYITQSIADANINRLQRKFNAINNRLFMIPGNHDGVGGSAPQTKNYAGISKMNESYVVRNGDDPYFYIDIEKPKLRLIFLATNQRVTIGQTEYNYWGIFGDQLRWFGQIALDVEDGRDVIIFSHIGTYHNNFSHNKESMCGICNAFNAHSTYDVHNDNSQSVFYTADFTALNDSKILVWNCGHAHYDWIVPSSFSGLNFPQVVTTCSLMYQATGINSEYVAAGAVSPEREDKTVLQDAWDTMIYRPDENKLYYVRFGAGSDREIDLSRWDISL